MEQIKETIEKIYKNTHNIEIVGWEEKNCNNPKLSKLII
jgi:hypothetical protein